jgi:chromosome segregation ATPase
MNTDMGSLDERPIDRLERAINTLVTDNNVLRQEIRQLRQSKSALMNELEEAKRRNEELGAEINSLKECGERLSHLEERKEQLKNSVADVIRKLDIIESMT